MSDFSDFDRYCDEHAIIDADAPIAFAAWLHEISGGKWDGEAGPVPTPYDPACNRYARDMSDNDDFLEDGESREDYIRGQEGTYNPVNGHFLCDRCYINEGMPSSPTGWICP